jgi:hypothetical protein
MYLTWLDRCVSNKSRAEELQQRLREVQVAMNDLRVAHTGYVTLGQGSSARQV